MNKRHLTSIYFFAYVGSLAIVVIFVYLIMERIETATTLIETKIKTRDIVDVVDNDYKLDMVTVKPDENEFLNELTEFFFRYHQNSKKYRQKLSRFGEHRRKVLKRFTVSNIKYYDLSTAPNPQYPTFVIDFKIFKEIKRRSVPFTNFINMNSSDLKMSQARRYFICTGRIGVTAYEDMPLEVQIIDESESDDQLHYMKYYLLRYEDSIINLNRIIPLRHKRSTKLRVIIRATEPIKITKTDVSCVLFEDVM